MLRKPFCIVCLSWALWAQAGAQTAGNPTVQTATAVEVLSGTDTTIDANDPTLLLVDSIVVTGLHRTRRITVIREMTFGQGVSLPRGSLAKLIDINQKLVYNTGLFNRVEFRYEQTNDRLIVYIDVAERWYLWPEFVFDLRDRTIQDWLKDPDWQRITYGVALQQRNLTGRNDNLTLRVTQGFDQVYSLSYGRPFLFPKQLIGGGASIYYRQNEEVLYSTTGGEVNRIRLNGEPLTKSYGGSISMGKRFTQFSSIGFSVGYRQMEAADTLIQLNPTFYTTDDGTERNLSLGISWSIDTRDVRAFPLNGARFLVQASYTGTGISTSRYGKMDIKYYRYSQLNASRFYLAYGGGIAMLFGTEVPYGDKRYLSEVGVRGFNSYSVDGSFFGALRSELRYELIKRHIVTWKRLPRQFEDFPFGIYPFLFADLGIGTDETFSNTDTRFKNRLLGGMGMGVDFIYFYDNILRLELARNNFGETNILVNFGIALR